MLLEWTIAYPPANRTSDSAASPAWAATLFRLKLCFCISKRICAIWNAFDAANDDSTADELLLFLSLDLTALFTMNGLKIGDKWRMKDECFFGTRGSKSRCCWGETLEDTDKESAGGAFSGLKPVGDPNTSACQMRTSLGKLLSRRRMRAGPALPSPRAAAWTRGWPPPTWTWIWRRRTWRRRGRTNGQWILTDWKRSLDRLFGIIHGSWGLKEIFWEFSNVNNFFAFTILTSFTSSDFLFCFSILIYMLGISWSAESALAMSSAYRIHFRSISNDGLLT